MPWHELAPLILIGAVACGGSPASVKAQAGEDLAATYAQHGDESLRAGDPGQAMAAYDKALETAAGDPQILAKRKSAVSAWVKQQAALFSALGDHEQAFDLLNALAAQGRSRDANEAVDEHVVPALDRHVAALWPAAAESSNPSQLWDAVQQGEAWTKWLPARSASVKRLDSLRAQGAEVHRARGAAATHPGAQYFHEAIVARYERREVADSVARGLEPLTALKCKFKLDVVPGCEVVGAELASKLEATNLFPAGGDGIPVDVMAVIRCLPLEPSWTTEEQIDYIDVQRNVTLSQSCRNRTAQSNMRDLYVRNSFTGRSERIGHAVDLVTIPECSVQRDTTVTRSQATETMTVEHVEKGFRTDGALFFMLTDTEHVFHLSSEMVQQKLVRTGSNRGALGEYDPDISRFAFYAAHGAWLEMVHARAEMLGLLAEEARERGRQSDAAASTEPAVFDQALGERVVAMKLGGKVAGADVEWFAAHFGGVGKALSQLVLGEARPSPESPSFGHQLALPQLESGVARRAEAQALESGVDGY